MNPTVEDLIARARRGQLSPEEQRRLQVALESSLEARLLCEAGMAFDGESPVRPGDDELIARMAARVALRPRRRRGKRWSALLAVAGLLLAPSALAGGVVALHLVWQKATTTPEPTAVPAASSSSAAVATRSVPRRPAPAKPEPSSEPASSAPVPTAAFPDLPPSARQSPQPRSAAAEVFALANEARRQGRTAAAIQAYEQLQREHPQSPEAKHADMTLAELYLGSGRPEVALRRFRLYSGGALKAEALWGEARALRQLGRSSEERQTLEALIRQFPGSAYVGAARKRLGELGG